MPKETLRVEVQAGGGRSVASAPTTPRDSHANRQRAAGAGAAPPLTPTAAGRRGGRRPSVGDSSRESIRVVLRCRPAIGSESRKLSDGLVVDEERSAVDHVTCGVKRAFTYDRVYGAASTQRQVFEAAEDIVDSSLRGLNGTIIAYGQTSSGKTHTMMGVLSDPEMQGVVPSVVDRLFRTVGGASSPSSSSSSSSSSSCTYLISIAFLEIYNECVRDLLGRDTRKSLDVRQGRDLSFYVPDLSKHVVKSKADLMRLVARGNSNRTTSSTTQNEASSRSHSMITLHVEKVVGGGGGGRGGGAASAASAPGHVTAAKLNLVDLAGSERLQDATTACARESVAINQSLTCLANVIGALTSGADGKFVPYRDSKLTRLLKDSLGGNAKTLMIACVNGAEHNLSETLSTLRYAARAKKIKNKPKVNQDPKDALLAKLLGEIDQLKQHLSEKDETQMQMAKMVRRLADGGDHSTVVFGDGDEQEAEDAAGDNEKRLNFLRSFLHVPPAAKSAAAKWAARTFGASRMKSLLDRAAEEGSGGGGGDGGGDTAAGDTEASSAAAAATTAGTDSPLGGAPRLARAGSLDAPGRQRQVIHAWAAEVEAARLSDGALLAPETGGGGGTAGGHAGGKRSPRRHYTTMGAADMKALLAAGRAAGADTSGGAESDEEGDSGTGGGGGGGGGEAEAAEAAKAMAGAKGMLLQFHSDLNKLVAHREAKAAEERRAATLASEVSELREANARLHDEARAERERLAAREREAADLRFRVAQLEAEQQAHNHEHSEAVRKLSSESKRLQENLAREEGAASNLRRELSDKAEELARQLEVARDEVTRAHEENRKAGEVLQRAEKEAAEARRLAEEATRDAEARATEAETAREAAREAACEAERARKEAAAAATAVAATAAESSCNDDGSVSVAASDAVEPDETEDLDELDRRSEEREAELVSLRERLEAAERQWQEQMVENTREMEQMIKEREDAGREVVDELTAELDDLRRQLAAARAEAGAERAEAESLRARLAQAESDGVRLRQRLEPSSSDGDMEASKIRRGKQKSAAAGACCVL